MKTLIIILTILVSNAPFASLGQVNKKESVNFPQVCFIFNTTDTIPCFGNDSIAKKVIKDISKALVENPHLVIELSGHCGFDESLTQQLSVGRAEYVKKILINLFGINSKRIVAIGYGATKLLVDKHAIDREPKDRHEIIKARNRRVVFSVLRNNFEEE